MTDSVLPVLASASRFCADRCYILNNKSTGSKRFMGISEHKMLATVTGNFKVAFANWWCQSSTSSPAGSATAAEVNNTQALTFKVGLEYPSGTFTELKWSTATSVSISAGSTVFCDAIPVIPAKGDIFRLHVYVSGAAGGIPYHEPPGSGYSGLVTDSSHASSSTTLTDYHMGGDPAPDPENTNGNSVLYPPVAIVGDTTAPAVIIFGDSSFLGQDDQAESATDHGAIGDAARSLYRLGIPWANMALSGERGLTFYTHASKRLALQTYASHAICNYGGNDIYDSKTLTQLQGMVTSILGVFTVPASWVTIFPLNAVSSNSYSSPNDQTISNSTQEAVRVSFNSWLLGGVSGLRHIFDESVVIEDPAVPGTFKVSATPYTSDGSHLNQAGEHLLANSGYLDTRVVGSFGVPFAAGAYTLSGQAAATKATRRIVGAAGTIAFTGKAALPKATRLSPMAGGILTLTGQDARLIYPRKMAAALGSFTLGGQDAGLISPRKLTMALGGFTLSGQPALLKRGKLFVGAAGSFGFTGQSATLGGPRSLAAAAGALVLSGQAAALRATRRVIAALGSASLSGRIVSLLVTRRLVGGAGTFALNGKDAALFSGQHITALTGTFSVGGQGASMLSSRKAPFAAASYASNGQTVRLLRQRGFSAAAGGFSLGGQGGRLAPVRRIGAGAGTITLTGQPVSLRRILTLSASIGSINVAGQAAQFRRTFRIKGQVGIFDVDGQPISLMLITKRPPPSALRRFRAPALNRQWRAP
jgi:hypothetical protein